MVDWVLHRCQEYFTYIKVLPALGELRYFDRCSTLNLQVGFLNVSLLSQDQFLRSLPMDPLTFIYFKCSQCLEKKQSLSIFKSWSDLAKVQILRSHIEWFLVADLPWVKLQDCKKVSWFIDKKKLLIVIIIHICLKKTLKRTFKISQIKQILKFKVPKEYNVASNLICNSVVYFLFYHNVTKNLYFF